jgi:hypothetical protein
LRSATGKTNGAHIDFIRDMETTDNIEESGNSVKQDSITGNTQQFIPSKATMTDATNTEASSSNAAQNAEPTSHIDLADTTEDPLPSHNPSLVSPPDMNIPTIESEGITVGKNDDEKDRGDTLTEVSADEESPENDGAVNTGNVVPTAIVSSSKKTRPPYKYDPNKVTLRFLFANRDGLAVTVECNPSDTIGEVKGALLSVWPEGRY